MHSTAITIAAILHIQQFLTITGFLNDHDLSQESCPSLFPPSGYSPSTAPFPFLVTIQIHDGEYIPGNNYSSKFYTIIMILMLHRLLIYII